jgi:hypothetical protein
MPDLSVEALGFMYRITTQQFGLARTSLDELVLTAAQIELSFATLRGLPDALVLQLRRNVP